MPHVSVHYKVIIPAGHHRQPRNANGELEPYPSSEVDVDEPGNISPLYVPEIQYTYNGATGMAHMIFWSVTDGTQGQTYPAGTLTQSVGSSPLTITAWYYPTGGDGPGRTVIIDDAFSAIKGDFIDDTFVTVTSDPSLTSQANVVGVVPTAKAQTLQASASVNSTPEPFSKWISYGAGTANNNVINVPAGATGIAIAVYEKSDINIPKIDPDAFGAIYGTIIGGVAVDGGGAIIINGKPHPIDPWGPLMINLVNASLASAASKHLGRSTQAEMQKIAAQSVLEAIKVAVPKIEKKIIKK